MYNTKEIGISTTAKVLIGISPSGIFTFLSHIYDGKASDIQITTESGILDKLEENDIHSFSRQGFQIKIKDDVLIVMPPFLHDNWPNKYFHIVQNKFPVSLLS